MDPILDRLEATRQDIGAKQLLLVQQQAATAAVQTRLDQQQQQQQQQMRAAAEKARAAAIAAHPPPTDPPTHPPSRPSSVMDEMWARAVVPDCLRSFVGSRSMCRRGAAVPDRLVVLQACAQRDSKCARVGRACICLLQKPAAS